MLVCPSIVGRTFSQNLAILMLLLAESNKDSVGFRKKYADLAYFGRELRETGAQNLKAYGVFVGVPGSTDSLNDFPFRYPPILPVIFPRRNSSLPPIALSSADSVISRR